MVAITISGGAVWWTLTRWRQLWCVCSVKTVWSERFRGEFLTMGHYTNLLPLPLQEKTMLTNNKLEKHSQKRLPWHQLQTYGRWTFSVARPLAWIGTCSWHFERSECQQRQLLQIFENTFVHCTEALSALRVCTRIHYTNLLLTYWLTYLLKKYGTDRVSTWMTAESRIEERW